MRAEYAVQPLCRLLELPPSTYYYKGRVAANESQTAVKDKLIELAGQWPTYGTRRLAAELQRDGFDIGRAKTTTLMRQLGIQARQKRRKKYTTQSNHAFLRYPNLVLGLQVTFPDQVWVADITYIRLQNGFVYLAIVMDVFTRQIRGWHLSMTIDHWLTKIALEKALQTGRPNVHHSDQGVQYATPHYTDLLVGVAISMAEVGQAWQNGFAERVIRTIKEDEVDLSDYADFDDAFDQIGTFIDDVYTHKRVHSALGYLTPAEFEANWKQQQRPPERQGNQP